MRNNATLVGAMGVSLIASGCAPAPQVTIVNSQTSATQAVGLAGQPARVGVANPNGNLTLARAAVSGTKQKIDSYFALNGDCSSAGFPVAIVKTAPTHGTFVTAQGQEIPNFPKDAPRGNCDTKASPAVIAYYTSAAGFTGSDTVIVSVIWPGGGARLIEYRMTVEGNN
jgi:hypothetical protein